jgi:hypothetical protein
MRKNVKFNFINAVCVFAIIFVLAFTLTLISGGKAHAQGNYFNDYYVSLNGGVIQTSPSGLSSNSGGTINMSLGKNFNFGGLVIGGSANIGYASNGSWAYNNFDGYGDNETSSLYSVYYSAAIKAGYAFKNVMPFVKLGYIGYTYDVSYSYSGPYGNYYGASVSPVSSEGGLLYGAGVEYMFNRNWGVTAQYFGTSLSGSDRTNNYTIGVDFNF